MPHAPHGPRRGRAAHQDLIDHLLDGAGGGLWIPGAKPHARNEPVPFAPYSLPPIIRPHPINPEQTPVVLGTMCDGEPRDLLHCVALAHLAHGRDECTRCDPVWRTAATQWADVPDEGNHETLFGVVELTNPDTGALYQLNGLAVRLLVHIDDVPADWYRE